MSAPAPQPFAGHDPHAMEAREIVALWWQGSFDNALQVEAALARGGPPAPELTLEPRALEVARLQAPQLGDVVFYPQECRASVPRLAHRQRVMLLRAADGGEGVRAEQLFFREGPTHDRPFLPAQRGAAMGKEAFTCYPGCDPLFELEPKFNRWRGAMAPGACRYHHPEDGEVCAEFAMVLSEEQLWSRDRGLRLRDGGIRGEVDGFSWLLFDRRVGPKPPSVLARLMGVWEGTFRRYDGEGQWLESFTSTVVQRLEAKEGRWLYSQIDVYHLADGGQRRFRSSQTLEDGRIGGRTHIDEHKRSDDWRAWGPPHSQTDG